jgi:ankyrin repeat protein
MPAMRDNETYLNFFYEREKELVESKGYSRTMIAVKKNLYEPFVEIANVEELKLITKDKKNAFLLACELGYEKIAYHIYQNIGFRGLIFEENELNFNAFTYICLNKLDVIYNLVRDKRVINILQYADLEKPDLNNETLLIKLCKNKLEKYALDLLDDEELDLNIEHIDNNKKCALDYCKENNLEKVYEKLKEKISLEYKFDEIDENEDTFFIKLCKNKDKNKEALNIFKKYNSCFDFKLQHQNKAKMTCLMYALQNRFFELARKIVNEMKTCNNIDMFGNSELIHCVYSRSNDLVKRVLKKTSLINHVNNKGDTAILLSTKKNLEDISLSLLTHKKIDLTILDEENTTPLFYASSEDSLKVVQEILKHDCAITQREENGEDALSMAVLNVNSRIALAIAEKWTGDFNHFYQVNKTDTTIYMRAIHFKLYKVAKLIISSGKYNIGYIDNLNKSSLILAIESLDDNSIVSRTEESKEESLDKIVSSIERSVITSQNDCYTLVEEILKYQGDIKCGHQDNSGNTALMYCAFKNHYELGHKIIKRSDCNPACSNNEGLDALGYFLLHGHENLVLEMLKRFQGPFELFINDIYLVSLNLNMPKLSSYTLSKIKEYRKNKLKEEQINNGLLHLIKKKEEEKKSCEILRLKKLNRIEEIEKSNKKEGHFETIHDPKKKSSEKDMHTFTVTFS